MQQPGTTSLRREIFCSEILGSFYFVVCSFHFRMFPYVYAIASVKFLIVRKFVCNQFHIAFRLYPVIIGGMAFLLYSGLFSNGKSILVSNKSKLKRCNYWCVADANCKQIMRMGARRWTLHRMKLIKSNYKRLGSKCLDVFSKGMDVIDLSCGISSLFSEVTFSMASLGLVHLVYDRLC